MTYILVALGGVVVALGFIAAVTGWAIVLGYDGWRQLLVGLIVLVLGAISVFMGLVLIAGEWEQR